MIMPTVKKKRPKMSIITLTKLFNAMLEVRYCSQKRKTSIVVMIPKSEKLLLVPYPNRCIRLSPGLSKLCKKVFLWKINKLIPLQQSGVQNQCRSLEQVIGCLNNFFEDCQVFIR